MTYLRASLNLFFVRLYNYVHLFTHLSSNHHQTTWARRRRSGSPDRNSRGRCSPAGTAVLPCPFDCSQLLSSPFYRYTYPRRRNRDPSKSDADSQPPRSTSPCSRVHSCTCRWCSGHGRCSRALRTRRVAGSTPCLSSRDCIGTRRLCTRLNRDDGIICWWERELFTRARDSPNWFRIETFND